MDTTQYQELIQTIQNSNARDWFDYLTSIGSLAISILAVIIGIRISNKLSLKNKVLEKQLDTVFSLLQILQHQRFHLAISIGGDGYYGHHISILELVKDKSPNSDINKARENKLPIYFRWDGYHELKTIKAFKNNPFLPISIQKHIDNMVINNYAVVKKVDHKSLDKQPKVVHTINVKENRGEQEFERNFLSDLNSSTEEMYSDFPTFLGVFENFVDSIEDWLRKYNATDINLNLQSKHSLPIS
jgi:hypothetical protein